MWSPFGRDSQVSQQKDPRSGIIRGRHMAL
jgi:hypothetical protein